MDKIQDVLSLVMSKKSESVRGNNAGAAEAVFIKSENADSDSFHLADKTGVNVCHVLPVLDVAEEISVSDVIIEQDNRKGIEANIVEIVNDPTENEEQDTKSNNTEVRVKFAVSKRNPIKFKVVNDTTDNFLPEDSYDYPPLKDGQNQMHFVKYMKVDNKTVKIWECGFCAKEFRHQYTLTRHLPTHTGERNFKCEICGKAFRQLSTLSQHRAIHTDARPYVCELCKKTFNRVSTLISHRKTHSDYKPHKCSTCGKGFHQKGNLRNHIYTHTNMRPYKCELCGKGFNQMSNLMCHKSHSHGNKTQNICYICNIEFSRKNALRSHEEYKHGIRHKQGVVTRESYDKHVFEVAKPKRHKENLHILHLPNGDRTISESRVINSSSGSSQTFRIEENEERVPSCDSAPSDGVIIDPITTRAMKIAEQEGQTPFALLKPAKGIPVLVKVHPAPNNKQMLVPATAEDLKSAGKITVSPNVSGENQGSAKMKAVQIKVPVVATVIQVINSDGSLKIQVEPPAPENYLLNGAKGDAEIDEEDEEEDIAIKPEITVMEEEVDDSPDALEVEVNGEQDLLHLASTGDIQFVRESSDGMYEVLSQEEAAHIIHQPGGTMIEVLEDNVEVPKDHNNLSAFLEAIRSAGYQVGGDDEKIVITATDSEVVAEDIIEQEIVYADGSHVILESENGEVLTMDTAEGSPPYVLLEETSGMISEALEVVSSNQ